VSENPPKITALFGVYDADATIWGEMTYWLGARFGVRHCSLCDITHSLFKEKSDWQARQKELLDKYGVDFQAFHRNDQPDEVRKVIDERYPAVISKDETGNFAWFMGDAEIKNCEKSPAKFMAEIIKRLP
jgi:hypothetical protein